MSEKKEAEVETVERFKQAVFQELETMRKQQQQTVEALTTLAQAVAQMKDGQGQPEQPQKGKGASIADVILALLAEDLQGRRNPVDNFTKNIENMARMADALDRIRSPPDYTGEFAKRVLMKTGTKVITHGGFPRYMTKDELKRYDSYLNRAFGIEGEGEGEEGEKGEEHEHI